MPGRPYRGPVVILSPEEAKRILALIPDDLEFQMLREKLATAVGANPVWRTPLK